MKNKTRIFLTKLGISPSLKGFNYLIEMINIINEENEKKHLNKITLTELYSKIMIKYNNESNLKAIARASELAFKNAKNKDLFLEVYMKENVVLSDFIWTTFYHLKEN